MFMKHMKQGHRGCLVLPVACDTFRRKGGLVWNALMNLHSEHMASEWLINEASQISKLAALHTLHKIAQSQWTQQISYSEFTKCQVILPSAAPPRNPSKEIPETNRLRLCKRTLFGLCLWRRVLGPVGDMSWGQLETGLGGGWRRTYYISLLSKTVDAKLQKISAFAIKAIFRNSAIHSIQYISVRTCLQTIRRHTVSVLIEEKIIKSSREFSCTSRNDADLRRVLLSFIHCSHGILHHLRFQTFPDKRYAEICRDMQRY